MARKHAVFGNRNAELTLEESTALIARVETGESVYAIARELGRNPASLYSLLKRRHGQKFAERNSYWPSTVTMPTDPATLGYIAGIFDGEGSLQRRSDGLWTIAIGMTDEPLITWFGTLGGGNFEYQPPGKRKRLYTWKLGRRQDVLVFLRAIQPYLRVKQARACAAIAELEIRLAKSWEQRSRATSPSSSA